MVREEGAKAEARRARVGVRAICGGGQGAEAEAGRTLISHDSLVGTHCCISVDPAVPPG